MIKRNLIALLAVLSISSPAFVQTIYEAARNGDLETVKKMVDENPSLINEGNEDGETVLLYAAFGGQVEIVRFLLSLGADVNAASAMGETALHYAAYAGQSEAAALLLDSGADVNAGNIERNTPLHYTVFGDRIEAMELLIQRGADINLMNAYDYTPLDFADANGRPKSAGFLESQGGQRVEIGTLEVAPLTEKIYRISYPFGDLSNIGLFSGSDGLLLVDTGCSERAVPELKKTLKKLGEGPVKIIINTHLHRDHIAGNSIADENTVIINYTLLDSLTSTGVLTKIAGPLTGRTGKSFGDYYTLNFNGEEIRLIPHPGIHTDADMLVHFTDSGVVHTGDLLISQSFPSVRQKADAYLAFLETVADVFPKNTILLCGHGKEFTLQDVRNYRDMLASAADIVKENMKDGKGKKQIRESGVLSGYEAWGVFIPILNVEYWMNAVYANFQEMKQE